MFQTEVDGEQEWLADIGRMDTVEFAGDLEMSTNNSVCGSTTHTPSVRFDMQTSSAQLSPDSTSISRNKFVAKRDNDEASSGDSTTSMYGSTEKLLEALSAANRASPTNLTGVSVFYRSEPRLSLGQSDTLQPAMIRKQNSENRQRRGTTGYMINC